MDLKGFPVLDKKYILRQYRIDGQDRISIYGLYNSERADLNNDSAYVVRLFTGEYSIQDILDKILSRYKESSNVDALKSIEDIIDDLKNRGIVFFLENRHKAREFPKPLEMRGLLNNIYLRLINECNLMCRHCSVDPGGDSNDRLSDDIIFGLIDEIYRMMVPMITFTGGEPTLVESLPDLIHYASKKPIKSNLMTNGFGITIAYAERLVNNGLSQVNISLDGADESTHDNLRGVKGSYRKAIESIEFFKDLGIYVETTTVITGNNHSGLDKIMEIGEKYKLNNMKFTAIIPFKRGKKCNYIESFNVYRDNIGKFIYRYGSDNVFKKDLSNRIFEENLLRCSAGDSVLCITPGGDVLPCNNFDTIILGNIKSCCLYDIYCNSSMYKDLPSALRIRDTECQDCEILDDCHGGCAMVSYAYNGVYNKCDITRKAVVNEILNNKKGDKL